MPTKIPTIDISKLKNKKKELTPYSPSKQAEGLKKRLEGSGIDVEKVTDDRNFIEKALNLNQKQGFFFDLIETIERPQRALFGAIDAIQKGKSIGKGALEGFTGKEEIMAKDLLHTAGMLDSGDKIGWDDALGLVGEVFVDPIDVALWGGALLATPVSGGSSLAAAAALTNAMNTAQTAGDIAKVTATAEDAAKATHAFLEVSKAQKVLASAKIAEKPISTLRLAGRAVKKVIKKGTSVADNGITGLLKYLDNINAAKVAKFNTAAVDINKLIEPIRLAEKYTNFKGAIAKVFDAAKDLPAGIWEKAMGTKGAKRWVMAQMKFLDEYGYKTVDDFAALHKLDPIQLNDDVKFFIENSKLKPTGDIANDVLGTFQQPLDAKTMEVMRPMLERVGFKIDDVYKKGILDNGVEGYFAQNETVLKAAQDAVMEHKLDYEEFLKVETKAEARAAKKIIKDAEKAAKEAEFLEKAKKTDPKRYAEYIEKKKKLAKEFAKTGKKVDETAVLAKKVLKAKKLQDIKDFENIMFREALLPRFLSPDDLAKVERLAADPAFAELAEACYKTQTGMLDILQKGFKGVKLGDDVGEGYLRRVQTKEFKKLVPADSPFKEYMSGSEFKGNVNAFTNRTYRMSTYEANMVSKAHMGTLAKSGALSSKARQALSDQGFVQMFEEGFKKSIDEFMVEAPKFAESSKLMEEVLVRGWMADDNIIQTLPVVAGKSPNIPAGFSKFKRESLVNKLEEFAKYTENPEVFLDMVKRLPMGNNLIMDANVYNMLGNLSEPQKINAVVKFLDTMNNMFKKFKLLSPGFQMRNIMGNTTNMYLSGVPINQTIKYYGKAHNILTKGDDILKKAVLKGEAALTGSEKEIYNLYQEFIKNGFHEVANELYQIPDDIAKATGVGKKNVIDKINKLNNDANIAADKRFRLGLMMYAKDNPDIYLKIGSESPAAFVRRTLFDYEDLSAAEQSIMKKVIPFYTWTKKNLVFQMSNLPENTRRYKNIVKTIRGMWDMQGIDVNNIEEYKKTNFWIPIPGLTKDGKYTAIKANLPVGDLSEFFDSPLKKIIGSVAPLIKAPFEMATNKQAFLGQPISEFKGQKGITMPNISRKLEYGLSQTGLDVPLTFISDLAKTAVTGLKGDLSGQSGIDIAKQALGRSMVSTGDEARGILSKEYEELGQLQDLFKYYKQEGVPIKTIAEMQNQNKTLQQILAKMKALG